MRFWKTFTTGGNGIFPVHLRLSAFAAVSLALLFFQLSIQQAHAADWLYQLQDAAPAAVAQRAAQIAVIDYSRDGTDRGRYLAADLKKIKRAGTVPISYMSIGEAESYRFYWDKDWVGDDSNNFTGGEPAWMGHTNPDWVGNYKVRYWHKDWRTNYIAPYLDRIIKQGFKGVYLDIVDAFEYWADSDVYTVNGGDEVRRGGDPFDNEALSAKRMINLLVWIKTYAANHGGGADFQIIPQNGERLLKYDDGTLLALIDGIGVEDVWYDETALTGTHNSRLAFLRQIKRAGKSVYAVDYVDNGGHKNQANLDRIGDFAARCVAEGFSCYAGRTDRELDEVNGVVIHSGKIVGDHVRQLATKKNVDVMVGNARREDLFKVRGVSVRRHDAVQDFRAKQDVIDLSLALSGVRNGRRVAAVRITDEGNGTFRLYINSRRAGGETSIWLFDSALSTLDINALVASGALKLTADLLHDVARTKTTRSLAANLDDIREFASDKMVDVFANVDDLTDRGKRAALRQIAGGTAPALARTTRNNLPAFMGLAKLRMSANRAQSARGVSDSGGEGVQFSAEKAINMAAIKQYHGGAAAGRTYAPGFSYSGPQASGLGSNMEAGALLFGYDGRNSGGFPVSLWGRTYRMFGNHELLGDAGYSFSATGFAGGVDIPLSQNILLGVIGGYSEPKADYDDINDDAVAKARQLGAYVDWTQGQWHFNSIASYQMAKLDILCSIQFGGLNRAAHGQTESHSWMVYSQIGRQFNLGAVLLTPEASVEVGEFTRDAYSETGAGVLNLTVGEEQDTTVKTSIGAKIATQFAMTSRLTVIPELRLRWSHAFSDLDVASTARLEGANSPSQTFQLVNEGGPQDQFLLGVGIAIQNTNGFDISLDLDSALAKDYFSGAVSLSGSAKF